MKIKLLSDLHLEFGQYIDTNPDKDVTLVLAGDICVGTSGYEFILDMCNKYKYVVYVLGNHEFYHNEVNGVIAQWRKISDDIHNLYFLNNDWCILDGVRFLGGTMWTGFNDGNDYALNAASYRMNDYRHIKNNNGLLDPSEVYEYHKDFRKFLAEELNKPTAMETVVVTHHSPADPDSVTAPEIFDTIRYCYHAGMTDFMYNHDIKMWLHGHTHKRADYMTGNTRIVCNPRGYVGYELSRGFDDNLILEI